MNIKKFHNAGEYIHTNKGTNTQANITAMVCLVHMRIILSVLCFFYVLEDIQVFSTDITYQNL